MLVPKIVDGKTKYIDIVTDVGTTDYVKDGEIHRYAATKSVLVGSADDLNLLNSYDPGTIAYTAGYLAIWQKDVDGTWENIVGGN